ncbi:BMP family ABC transporter substrate-binding protein [Kitasatospora sp. NPDC004240]
MVAAVAAGVLTVGVVGGVLLFGQDEDEAPPARAREYTATQACLLTDPFGVGGVEAAEVWAAMQDSSAATKAKVSSLPVIGDRTVGNAVPYANTLITRKCDVVLGASKVETEALAQIAPVHPGVRFIVVGDTPPAGNLTVIARNAGTKAAVSEALTAVLRTAKPQG